MKLAEFMRQNSTGYKEVFAKMMASRIRPWLDNGTVEQVLPEGYKYAFLIRHPAKAIGSKLKGKHVEDGKTSGKA